MDALRCPHTDVGGDLPAPRAPSDERLPDSENVKNLEHDVGVDPRLDLAVRGIALAKSRAVDPKRAPPVAQQRDHVRVEAMIAERRWPEHDWRTSALVVQCSCAKTGLDTAEVGCHRHEGLSIANAWRRTDPPGGPRLVKQEPSGRCRGNRQADRPSMNARAHWLDWTACIWRAIALRPTRPGLPAMRLPCAPCPQ